MDLNKIQNFWLSESENSMDSAIKLFSKRKYMHSMFFLHLAIEKMLKFLYVNQMKEEAPFGHNLQNIALKINTIIFPKDIIDLLSEIIIFNISSRYDDYTKNFYQVCDKNLLKIT